MSQRFGFGLALIVGLAAAGCGQSEPGKLKVAFITNNPDEFWTYAERGCEKAARELDVEVIFRRPANATAQEQQDLVNQAMVRGVKGIAISPIDATNQAGFLNDVAGKVPLITQDSDLPAGSKRKCYLGTDNYGAGKAAGAMVKEVLPEGGYIVVCVGSLDAENARLRRQGVFDELAGTKDATGPQLGKYEVLDTLLDQASAEICRNKLDTFLTGYKHDPAKLCIVGLYAYNPPQAILALENAKYLGKSKIVAFDERKDTLDGIEKGHIQGTVVQQPFLFGYESVKILVALAKGEKPDVPADGVKPIPFEVIKKDGVEAFRKKLVELAKKQESA
jgi:ribose transport system substrate-binding protein